MKAFLFFYFYRRCNKFTVTLQLFELHWRRVIEENVAECLRVSSIMPDVLES